MTGVHIFTSEYKKIGGIGQHIECLEKKFSVLNIKYRVGYPFYKKLNKVQPFLRQAFLSLYWQFQSFFTDWGDYVINIHTGPGGVIFFPFFAQKKIICTCHHTYHQQITMLHQWYKYPIFIFERILYGFCDSIVAVSESTKNILIKKYKIEADKIAVLSNFCDYHLDSDQITREEKSMLFIGRFDERKNPVFMLEMISELKKIGEKYMLHMVGSGKLLSVCKKIVLDNYLSQQVFFHSHISETEKRLLMRKCNFLIVPSIFEGQGIVCLEGILSGMCVLTNNVDGLRDVCAPKNRFNNLTEALTMITNLAKNPDAYKEAIGDNMGYPLKEMDFRTQLMAIYFPG